MGNDGAGRGGGGSGSVHGTGVTTRKLHQLVRGGTQGVALANAILLDEQEIVQSLANMRNDNTMQASLALASAGNAGSIARIAPGLSSRYARIRRDSGRLAEEMFMRTVTPQHRARAAAIALRLVNVRRDMAAIRGGLRSARSHQRMLAVRSATARATARTKERRTIRPLL